MTEKFYDAAIIYLNSGYMLHNDVINIIKCCKQCSANIPKSIVSLISSSLSSNYILNNMTKYYMKELILYNTSSFTDNVLDTIININSISILSLHKLYLNQFTIVNKNDSNCIKSSSIHSLDLTENILHGDVLIDTLYHYSLTKLYDLNTLILDDSLQLDDSHIQNIIDILPTLHTLSMRRILTLQSIEILQLHQLQDISFANCNKLNNLTFEKGNSLLKLDISWTYLNDDNLNGIIESCTNLKILISSYCMNLKNIDITSSTIEEIQMMGCLNIKTMKLHCNKLRGLYVKSCRDLEEVDLDCHQLKELDLSMLQKLVMLKLKLPSLSLLQLTGCKSLSVSKKELKLIIKDCLMLNIDTLIASCIEGSGISFDNEMKSLQQNKKLLDASNNSYNRPFNHRRSASV